MIILLSEANHLITNDTMFNIVGWVISTLILALGGLITYIWRSRKKQLDLTAEQQSQLNLMFQEEYRALSMEQTKQSKEQASVNQKLNTTMDQMGKSMDGLTSFLKDTTSELREEDKDLSYRINDHEKRISHLEGSKK